MTKIYLPTDDKNKFMMQDVSYNKKELIETVNAISLKLGGKRVISREKYFKSRNQRIYNSITEREAKFFNASSSSLYQMKPRYEIYYNEDQIIRPMLTLKYQTQYGSIKFIDYFCFSALYNYLESSHNFNNPEYLEIINEYLNVFQFVPQKKYITEEDMINRYFKIYNPYLSTEYERWEFRIRRAIAEENEKVLSLKRTIE